MEIEAMEAELRELIAKEAELRIKIHGMQWRIFCAMQITGWKN